MTGLTGLTELHKTFLDLISLMEFARAQASVAWKPPKTASLLCVRHQMG